MSDRAVKPTKIHIVVDPSMERLCGDETERHIAEKYMSDEFYRTLPDCEECEELLLGIRNNEPMPEPTLLEKVLEVKVSEEIFLIDFKEMVV
jgi:hypothetical protein